MNELNKKQMERYSRQIMLDSIGYNGQKMMRDACVCVAGAGGLGSPILLQLAAMGVGKIRIIDGDYVELSNLHRQTLYRESDVGKIKVSAAAGRLSETNPDCVIEALPVSINDSNAEGLVRGCSVVIDALDTAEARSAVNRQCMIQGIPFIHGGALEGRGQVFTATPETACFDCVFRTVNDSEQPTCSTVGVFTPVLAIVASIQVAEAVRIITGRKPLLADRLLHVDLDGLTFTPGITEKDSDCPVCGSHKKEGVSPPRIRQICGRNGGGRTFTVSPEGMHALDLTKIAKHASKSGYSVETPDMGLCAKNGSISITLLKFGSATITGVPDIDEAAAIYCAMTGNKI